MQVTIIIFAILGVLTVGYLFAKQVTKALKVRNGNLSLEHSLYQSNYETNLYSKGYIFCGLYKMTDIVNIAAKNGIHLSHPDVMLIINEIKKDFTIEEGITASRIKNYILMHHRKNIVPGRN